MLKMKRIEDKCTKTISEYLFLDNGVVVGECQISNEVTDGELFIHSINSIIKNKGNGTRMIKTLLNLPNVEIVCGESVEEAKGFWVKVGAVFYDDNEFSISR